MSRLESMSIRLTKLTPVLLLSCFLGACSAPPPRNVSMDIEAVNTADKILIIEGTTDLPSGAKLEAELRTRDDKILLRDFSSVSRGGFYFGFDMESLSEFSSYKLFVSFEPEEAPIGVRYLTGLWGEALQGPGVHRVDERKVFWQEQEILLSQAAKGKDWEGRDFVSMDGSDRIRLTEQMERYLELQPEDRAAKLALAKAYIASDKGELAHDSRAHALLLETVRFNEEDRLGQLARALVETIDHAEELKQREIAKRKAAANGQQYRQSYSVAPGKSIGAFKLGAPYKLIARYFKLDRPADFKDGIGDQTVVLKDFHNLKLKYDISSKGLVSVMTTSNKFKLPEGLGVGNSLQELQKAFGEEVVRTPRFFFIGRDPSGQKLYKGKVETLGLEFGILRKVDTTVGLPIDKVVSMKVFKP